MIIADYFRGLFSGSPKTASNKPKADGSIEAYSDTGRKTRQQISYHHLNGTDIPALIKTATTGIIGAGISIQSRTQTESIDNEFEELIKEHGKKKNFEVTQRFSRNGALEISISEKFRKGGILLRHHYNNAWDIPYRLELIGIDMINVSKYNKELNILNGLKKDNYGNIISYFIYTDSSKTTSVEVPATEISSYMDYWMDVSQYSAVARLSQILPELDEMLEYQKNELLGATDRSQGSVFWHTKMYDTVVDAMNELYARKKGSSKEVTSENFAELTEISRTITAQMSAQGIVPSGGVRPIPSEDQITQIDNKTSSTYEPFNENISNKITASQNRSRVITYKNMKNTNWATINALSSMDELENATEMRKITEDILDDYLERLFKIGVATKKINLSLTKYLETPYIYHKWEVLRQSRVVTDESKIANSTKINLATQATTLEKVYKKRGEDYKEEMLKQAQIDIALEIEKRALYKAANLAYPADVLADNQKTKEKTNA